MSKLTSGFHNAYGAIKRVCASVLDEDAYSLVNTVEAYHKTSNYRDIRVKFEQPKLEIAKVYSEVSKAMSTLASEKNLRIFVEIAEIPDGHAGIYGYIDVSIWLK